MSAADQDWWRCAALDSVPLGRADRIVARRGRPEVHTLPAWQLEHLRRCTSFETLERHAERLVRELRVPESQRPTIIAALREATGRGLMVSHREVRDAARAAGDDPPPAPVATLGILTRDRADAARRCVEGHVDNARHHGRPLRILLLDDSREAAALAASERAALSLSGGTVRIEHIGRAAKQRFAAALQAELGGAAAAELDFALGDPEACGHSTGANRNALLLMAAGERYLSADDDTLCRIAGTPEQEAGLALVADRDPTGFWFYSTPSDALDAASFSERDPIAVHEEVLGARLASLAAGVAEPRDLDLDESGPNLLRAVLEGRGRVAATACGYVGDSGMRTTGYYLVLADRGTRARLRADYLRWRHTRAVLRAAPQTAILDGGVFMAGLAGFDGRAVLPPFFPVMRNQDGIFAATLRASADDFIAQLPWAVGHQPVETRASDEAAVDRGFATRRLSDVVLAAVRSCPPSPLKGPGRISALGTHLRGLAAMTADEFHDFVRFTAWREAAFVVGRLEETLASRDPSPEQLKLDARRIVTAVRAAVGRTDFVAPVDLPGGRTPDEALRFAQRLVGLYGRLLEVWPDVVEAARRVNQGARG